MRCNSKRKTLTMKTNYLFILTLVLLMSAACNRQNKKQEEHAQQPAASADVKSKDQHLDLNDKLMSSFNPNWETEEPAPTDYPEYYGGSFVDNNGKFVVCVVGNPEQYRSTIAAILGTNDFLTEKCTYSYREMMQVMDRLDLFLSNNDIPQDHLVLKNFAGASADVLENRVVVNLTEVNDAVIQAFKKDISSSPVVKFKKGEMPVMM